MPQSKYVREINHVSIRDIAYLVNSFTENFVTDLGRSGDLELKL